MGLQMVLGGISMQINSWMGGRKEMDAEKNVLVDNMIIASFIGDSCLGQH